MICTSTSAMRQTALAAPFRSMTERTKARTFSPIVVCMQHEKENCDALLPLVFLHDQIPFVFAETQLRPHERENDRLQRMRKSV